MSAEAAWTSFRGVLGAPKYVCAPMVRQSELAFRLLSRQYGCQLTYTPMFVAATIVERAKETTGDVSQEFFDTDDQDRPLIVQVCGDDPAILAKAVTLVQHRCDAVDLNLGCPQRCALQGHFGAYLLESPELIEDIVRAMVAVATVPITCKIRIQEDISASIALAQRIERAGCAILTVHGRLRTQRHHEGTCNWDAIRAIRSSVPIPVIANGGINSLEDAAACLDYTGCAAVMSATMLLRNPAMFSGSDESIFVIAKAYLDLARKHPPRHPESARDHILTMVRQKCEQLDLVALASLFQHHDVLLPDQLEACLAHLAAATGDAFESKFTTLPSFKQIKCNDLHDDTDDLDAFEDAFADY
ncbi:unnamed protein product [Aphanomyces euteiches]